MPGKRGNRRVESRNGMRPATHLNQWLLYADSCLEKQGGRFNGLACYWLEIVATVPSSLVKWMVNFSLNVSAWS
jgi:hypothetical protein